MYLVKAEYLRSEVENFEREIHAVSVDDIIVPKREDWPRPQYPLNVGNPLFNDIKKNGVVVPILLAYEPTKKKLKVVAGYHRFLAARRLKLKTIPAYIQLPASEVTWPTVNFLKPAGLLQ